MSGRRIDDRSSWVGQGSSGDVFPDGVKKREFSSSEGCGELMDYQDSSEAIQRAQQMADRKAKSHKQPADHRA